MARWKDLPTELRLEIYALVLPSNTRYLNKAARFDRNRAILWVSSQIRSEALPIWLKSNIFVLYGCPYNPSCSKRDVEFSSLDFTTTKATTDSEVESRGTIHRLTWIHKCNVKGEVGSPEPQTVLKVIGNKCTIRVEDTSWEEPMPRDHAGERVFMDMAEGRAGRMLAAVELGLGRDLEIEKLTVQ